MVVHGPHQLVAAFYEQQQQFSGQREIPFSDRSVRDPSSCRTTIKVITRCQVDTATKAQLKKAGYRSKHALPSRSNLSLYNHQYIVRVKVCVLLFKIYIYIASHSGGGGANKNLMENHQLLVTCF